MPVISCSPFSAVSVLITAPLPSSTSFPPAPRTVVPSHPEAGLRGFQDWVTKVIAASPALWGSGHHATCPCEDTGAAPRGAPPPNSPARRVDPQDANVQLPRNGVGEGGKMVPPAHTDLPWPRASASAFSPPGSFWNVCSHLIPPSLGILPSSRPVTFSACPVVSEAQHFFHLSFLIQSAQIIRLFPCLPRGAQFWALDDLKAPCSLQEAGGDFLESPRPENRPPPRGDHAAVLTTRGSCIKGFLPPRDPQGQGYFGLIITNTVSPTQA